MTFAGILRAFRPATGVELAEQTRNRAVAWSMLSIYAVKLVTVAVSLISVPLAAGYLGLERYGLWISMSSFVSLLLLSDFGLGNNLTTMLAQSLGRGDREAASRQVSATFWAVLAGALLLFGLFSLLHPLVGWARVFNATGAVAMAEAPRGAFLLGLVAAAQLLGTLCQRLYAGLQRNYVGNLWMGVGSVTGLLALLAVTRLHGGLSMLVFALGVVPALVQLAGLAWILRTGDYGRLLPPGSLRWADCRHVMGGGALMFVVNLQAVFWLSKDSLMIAHVLSLEQVGGYNTAFRIYQSVFALLVGSLGVSLWPAYADAHARGDREWIRRTLRRSLFFGVGSMLAFSLFFVPAGHTLLTWYVGPALALLWPQLALLAFYFVILAAVNMLSFPLMGIGRISVIAWGGLAGGILTIPLAAIGMRHFGLTGLIATNLLCNIATQMTPLIYTSWQLGLIRSNSIAQ